MQCDSKHGAVKILPGARSKRHVFFAAHGVVHNPEEYWPGGVLVVIMISGVHLRIVIFKVVVIWGKVHCALDILTINGTQKTG